MNYGLESSHSYLSFFFFFFPLFLIFFRPVRNPPHWQLTCHTFHFILILWKNRRFTACLGALPEPLESILVEQNWFCASFTLFGLKGWKSIIVSRIDSVRSENFLLSIIITFRGTTKHKSLYLKINSNQINFNKINSI